MSKVSLILLVTGSAREKYDACDLMKKVVELYGHPEAHVGGNAEQSFSGFQLEEEITD